MKPSFFFFSRSLYFNKRNEGLAHIIYAYLYLQQKQKFKLSSLIKQQFSTAVRSTAHLELKFCLIYNHNNLLVKTCCVPSKIYYHQISFGSSYLGLLLSSHGSLSQGEDHLLHKFIAALHRGVIFFQNKTGTLLKFCSSIFRLSDS